MGSIFLLEYLGRIYYYSIKIVDEELGLKYCTWIHGSVIVCIFECFRVEDLIQISQPFVPSL